MLFNSAEFLFVFLPAVLGATWLATRRWGRSGGIYFLVLASVFFYGWWDVRGIAIIALSITVNYSCAILVANDQARWLRLTALWSGIVFDLGALAYFKYTNFFLSTLGLHAAAIALPLAISFYSFQQIAFMVDIYHARPGHIRFRGYLVSVLFFPHLIAGPLIHYNRIMEQFGRTFAVSAGTIAAGLPIFCVGLAKKVALADPLGSLVSPLFTNAETAPLQLYPAWIAALGYTAQLYFDFSGYSDMAIGLGLMFGIALPVNFNSPYRACSIIDFWRRWHMTLSEFLRTYLYVPLGGSRLGELRRYVNLLIVMLLGGLWHGAGWTFVFWGGLHGVFLAVNHFWRDIASHHLPDLVGRLVRGLSWPITFTAVVVAWVFFRATNFAAATNVLSGMAGLTFPFHAHLKNQGMPYGNMVVAMTLLVVSYSIVFISPNAAAIFALAKGSALRTRITPATALAVGVLVWLACFGVIGSVPSEFIYFQF